MDYNEQWFMDLDERQQKEIKFARVYANHYAHGTTGHNAYMLIAKLAQLLDDYSIRIAELEQKLESK